ncbi:hypothetical protein V494_06744 [Pseudogymnoascus sp. VKM F-4513 (FW-928)]|nr:hypothetical protein V494_06744 [Pseudogymnoascus sp. VKM F-4513 (FW-928)]
MSRLGWCQNVGVSGPGIDAAACSALEALQVVARTSSGTLHNKLWPIVLQAEHVATSLQRCTMAGELLRSDFWDESIILQLLAHGLTPLDSNSPPPTSSPFQTDGRHNDTAMLDSPADTPDRHTTRSFIESVAHGEGNGTSNAAAGSSGGKNGGKDGKGKDPFGAPGSCWKSAKYKDEVTRCESLLVHQEWSMSMFPPEPFGALDPILAAN